MHVLMICYLDASFTKMFSWHHEKSSYCFILVKTNASSSSEVRKQKPFQVSYNVLVEITRNQNGLYYD